MKAQRGSKGIVLLFNLGAHIGMGGQRHAQAALLRERNPVPFEQEAGWALRPVRTTRKISPPTGIRSPDSTGSSIQIAD